MTKRFFMHRFGGSLAAVRPAAGHLLGAPCRCVASGLSLVLLTALLALAPKEGLCASARSATQGTVAAVAAGRTATYGTARPVRVHASEGSVGRRTAKRHVAGASGVASVADATRAAEKKKTAGRKASGKASAKTAAKDGGKASTPGALHADEQAWSFGGGGSAAAMRKGIVGSTLKDKALAPSRRAQAGQAGHHEKSDVDEETAALAARQEQGAQSRLGISVDTLEQGWNVQHDGLDEDVPLESQHRVSAFAGVKDGDVTFGVGPQFLIRDSQQTRDNIANTDQPDVEAGVGMKMQIEF